MHPKLCSGSGLSRAIKPRRQFCDTLGHVRFGGRGGKSERCLPYPPKAHYMTSGTGELIDEFRIL